uniref:Glutathione peroxidase 3 n=1 Tax=Amphiprion percula TaxID=161767 RepID=A0A3P8T0X2_AMPPE
MDQALQAPCLEALLSKYNPLTTFLLSLQRCDSSSNGTLYKYQARTLNGSRTVNLSDYRGKSVLIVNVATY